MLSHQDPSNVNGAEGTGQHSSPLKAKAKYIEQRILYSETVEVLLRDAGDGRDGEQSHSKWDPLPDLLASSTHLDRLTRGSRRADSTTAGSEQPPLFGVDEDRWKAFVHDDLTAQLPEDLLQQLLSSIESRIIETCAGVARFYYGASGALELDAAKSRSLPTLITTRKHHLAELKKEISDTREKVLKEFAEFIEIYFTLLKDFETLLITYICTRIPESRAVMAEYFKSIVENIHLKLRCLKLTLLLHTYAGPHSPALHSTRQELERMHATLTKRIRAADIELGKYNGAGKEFEEIVEVYGRLVRDLEVVEEDIGRIKG
ncbi:HAUS augmin-like complex subunit 4 [Borealophlyctis nickersoniae]|nr:HAUS augmin-like complex subunit 4 [Borealophlyctis nickersoniae]